MEHTTQDCRCFGRRCARCKEKLCDGNFPIANVFISVCNACQVLSQERLKASIAARKIKDREYARARYQEHKSRYYASVQVTSARTRARSYHAQGDFTLEQWTRLKEQYNHRCLCCGSTDEKLTPDHVIPLSRGGSNNIDNIQPLCFACNIRKKDKDTDFRTKKA